MRSIRTMAVLCAALALGSAACGGLLEQVSSDEVAIAALIKTPDAKNPQTNETVPGKTAFTLFFGQADKSKIIGGEASDGAFKGLAGAKVALSFRDPVNGQVTVNVEEKGEGQYVAESTDVNKLAYVEGEYTLNVTWQDRTYRMKVVAPAPIAIEEFKGKTVPVIAEYQPGTPFTVTRSGGSANAADNDIAFVNLNDLSSGDTAPIFTNMPADALGFLKLVLKDTEWRAKSFTIPGNKFEANKEYLVTMTSARRGSGTGPDDGTTALFTGSSFLAGVADAGAIMTHPAPANP